MKTKEQQEAIDAMNAAVDLCKAAGVHVMFATAIYPAASETEDAHFSTRLSISGQRASGVSADHILCGMQREVFMLWSNTNHRSQLVWTEGQKSVHQL